MDYAVHLTILACIFSMLTLSLDLLIGHVGMLSLAHAGFYGIGAYTAALFATDLNVSFPVSLLAAGSVASVASLLVSLPSIRLSDDYFAIATFGLQMILFSVFNNWMELTHGPLGVTNIPHPVMFGFAIDNQSDFCVLAVVLTIFSFFVVLRLTNGPFGRVLHAIREDELFAQSLGKNTTRFKIIACAISSALAAVAGATYAYYASFIDPTSFTVMDSIMVIAMVLIGGSGSVVGPVIGAIALILLPEALRFLSLPESAGANLRQIIYGVLLIVVITYRPQGLLGRDSFVRLARNR